MNHARRALASHAGVPLGLDQIETGRLSAQGTIRADGRVVRPTYLMEVKRPGQSTSRFDSSRIVSEIPAAGAVRPLAESECPLVSR